MLLSSFSLGERRGERGGEGIRRRQKKKGGNEKKEKEEGKKSERGEERQTESCKAGFISCFEMKKKFVLEKKKKKKIKKKKKKKRMSLHIYFTHIHKHIHTHTRSIPNCSKEARKAYISPL